MSLRLRISLASAVVAWSTAALFAYELLPVLRRLTGPGLLGVLALALALGGALGTALGGYLALPRYVGLGCDLALGGALVFGVDRTLGIVAKWDGPTHTLALMAGAGALALAAAIVGLGFSLRTLQTSRRTGPARAASAALALILLCLVIATDRLMGHALLVPYPGLSVAMRASQPIVAGLAAIAVARTVELPWFESRLWLVGPVAAALVAGPLLDDPRDIRVLRSHPPARPLLALLHELGDFDGDGYSAWFGGADCAPFDRSRHPLARDVPGDGVDQDCHGGDGRPRHPAAPRKTPAALRPDGSSLVLITVDSLRADRLGLYGARRDTSPHLDAWAKHAVRYDQAHAAGGWTSLSLTSMFRGVYPRRLAWTRVFETNRLRLIRASTPLPPFGKEQIRKAFVLPLEDNHPTLTYLLKRGGYQTAAVIDDGATTYFDRELGAFQDFDSYHNVAVRGGDRKTSDMVLRWLEDASTSSPFFLWAHYFGPHGPNTRHPELRDFGPLTLDGYDEEVVFMDLQLGRVLDRLGELAKTRPIYVVITADHGEEFLENTRFHGLSLDEGATRIPMVVRGPGIEPGVRADAVSLVDVVPTLLARAGIATPAHCDGRDLLEPPPNPPRAVTLTTWRLNRQGEVDLDLAGMTDGFHKVTLDLRALDEEAYRVDRGVAREVPFSPAHRRLIDALYEQLGEDGPLRITN